MTRRTIIILITALSLVTVFGCGKSGDTGMTEEKVAEIMKTLDSIVPKPEGPPAPMTNDEINAFLAELNGKEPGTDIITASRMGQGGIFNPAGKDVVEPGEIAVLETTKGVIIFEFFTGEAPNHCTNFKWLANKGYYDGILFHRVIKDFMIQTGDILTKNDNPMDDGTGNPGYSVNAEFNTISHRPGIVSTARSRDPNSAGSQFFIMHGTSPHLDNQYTVFGDVIWGIEVVNTIATTQTGQGDRPAEDIHILRARVLNPDN